MAGKKKERPLRPKELKFVNLYFRTGNICQSAIDAGFSVKYAHKQSYLLVGDDRDKSQNKRIWDEVDKRRRALEDKMWCETEDIINGFRRLAFFDVRKLADEKGKPVKIQDLPDDVARSVVITPSGLVNPDRHAPLVSLARIKGLFAKDNEQTQPVVINDMSEDERDFLKIGARKLVEESVKLRKDPKNGPTG